MSVRELSVVVLVLFSACSPKAQTMADRFTMSEYSMADIDRQLIGLQAPIIVLGTVVDVREVGKPQRSPGDPRILTQRTVMSIRVEDILRGSLAREYVDVVFFTYSETNERNLGRLTYVPKTGHRRLFFLRTEGGVYRTMGDVTNYTLPVHSHPFKSSGCAGKSMGCCIAEIVLRRPSAEEVRGFLRDLPEVTFAAAHFCSPEMARAQLLPLAQDKDEHISAGAKDMIYMLGQWFP